MSRDKNIKEVIKIARILHRNVTWESRCLLAFNRVYRRITKSDSWIISYSAIGKTLFNESDWDRHRALEFIKENIKDIKTVMINE